MGDNPVPLTFAFKQDGEKLTGTVTGPQGQPLPLSDGKVVGDKVSFFVQADMGGTPTKFISEGVIKGDEITLNIKAEGGRISAPRSSNASSTAPIGSARAPFRRPLVWLAPPALVCVKL